MPVIDTGQETWERSIMIWPMMIGKTFKAYPSLVPNYLLIQMFHFDADGSKDLNGNPISIGP